MDEEILRPEEEGAGTQEIVRALSDAAKKRFSDDKKALQQIFQEEAKKKKGDKHLASFIVKFLKDPKYQKFFSLIVKLVKQNIPTDLILAVLTLISEEAVKIDAWLKNLEEIVKKNKKKLKETAFDKNGEIFPPLLEFIALVLNEALKEKYEETGEENKNKIINILKA